MVATTTLDERHREAKFRFLPFVVALLLDRPLPAGGRRIEMGMAEHLTGEVVESLHDILPQGVLRWLVHNGGWQVRALARPWNEQPTRHRIWDERLWDDMQLSFTHHAIDLLLIAFNLLARSPRPSGGTKKDEEHAGQRVTSQPRPAVSRQPGALSPKETARQEALFQQLESIPLAHNGDLLLHHILFRHLWPLPGLSTQRHRWLSNPLNLLAHPLAAVEFSETQGQSLARLLEADLEPILPWLLNSALTHGRLAEPQLWPLDTEAFSTACLRARQLARSWSATVSDRPDLLTPHLHYFSRIMNESTGTRADEVMAESATRSRRLSERQAFAARWLESLEMISQLAAVNERLTSIHPVDRDASSRLFLAEYQATDFDRAVNQLHHRRASWIPTIG